MKQVLRLCDIKTLGLFCPGVFFIQKARVLSHQRDSRWQVDAYFFRENRYHQVVIC
jgi:hypothetical protein